MNSDAIVERLVEDNVRLAYFFAKKHNDFDPDEALSLALEALHTAAQEFDESIGIPFGSYAGQRINWKFGSRRKRDSAEKRGGKAVVLSLDAPVAENSDAEFGDLIADDNADTLKPLLQSSDQQLIKRALRKLAPRDREIVRMRFGLSGKEPMILRDIGDKIGMSHERIRQLEADALQQLAKFCQRTPQDEEREQRRNSWRKRHPEYGHQHYVKNRSRYIEQQRRYRILNAAVIRQRARAFYRANIVRLKQRRKAVYWRDPETAKAKTRGWYSRNQDRALMSLASYRAKHRKELSMKQRARYHRQKDDPAFKRKRSERAARNRENTRAYKRGLSAALTDGYIRSKLAYSTGRSYDSFTPEEVQRRREHLLRVRAGRIIHLQQAA